MIYGYIIILRSGIYVASKFFNNFGSREDLNISMVASGIIAISDFFSKIAGNPIEQVIVGDFKLAIRQDEDIVVAILSDRNDVIADGIAKKYLKIISKCYQTKCPNIGEFENLEDDKDLKEILNHLDEEIRKINEQAKDMKYLH